MGRKRLERKLRKMDRLEMKIFRVVKKLGVRGHKKPSRAEVG
jgi:hypothetical protein